MTERKHAMQILRNRIDALEAVARDAYMTLGRAMPRSRTSMLAQDIQQLRACMVGIVGAETLSPPRKRAGKAKTKRRISRERLASLSAQVKQ